MRIQRSFELALLLCVGALLPVGCDAGHASNDEDDGDEGGSTSQGPGAGGSGNSSGQGAGSSSGPGGSGGGVTILPENMIDDLEDGNGGIIVQGGRQGYWYTYNDETADATQEPEAGGMFLPIPGGASSMLNAANTTGSGFISWGAGMGFDLNNEGDETGGSGIKNKYDATGFSGIAFYAKGTNPSLRLKLSVEAVIPEADNGTCVGGTTECNDAHGKIIALTPDWQQFQVSWSEFLQEGWGTPADFDESTLMQIQFQVPANTTFDFSIDDIGFY